MGVFIIVVNFVLNKPSLLLDLLKAVVLLNSCVCVL